MREDRVVQCITKTVSAVTLIAFRVALAIIHHHYYGTRKGISHFTAVNIVRMYNILMWCTRIVQRRRQHPHGN